MTHVLAFALGVLAGAIVCWIRLPRLPRPQTPLEFQELINRAAVSIEGEPLVRAVIVECTKE